MSSNSVGGVPAGPPAFPPQQLTVESLSLAVPDAPAEPPAFPLQQLTMESLSLAASGAPAGPPVFPPQQLTLTESLSLKVIQLQDQIIQLQAQLMARSHSASVRGTIYRMICVICKETIDLEISKVSEISVGGAPDVNGRFSPVMQYTSAKCTNCSHAIWLQGSIESCLKNYQIHRLFRQ